MGPHDLIGNPGDLSPDEEARRAEERRQRAEPAKSGARDWRYFSEALAWYEPNHGLTGAQIFGVVQQLQQALRDGRVTPADLGIEPQHTPPTVRLQDVTNKALLIELLRRLEAEGPQ